MGRGRRAVVLLAVALIVAWPALRRPPTDGFPLSTYPMFASDRGPTSVVATAVGRTAEGDRHRLSPEVLAGSDESMMAIAAANRAVRDDRADEWCREVAARADPTEVARVEVVVETHDAVASLADDADPLAIEVLATCEAP